MGYTRRGFGRMHPAVGFFYFGVVFLTCFLFQNPILLGILLLSGFFYQWAAGGLLSAVHTLLLPLPLALFLILLTPMFNHTGLTPLFYFNDLPVTKEAMVYGSVTALALMDTILWFRIFSGIVGKDQVIYLFGKPFPTMALLLGMIFRAVSQLRRELTEIRYAQRGLGLSTDSGPLRFRLKNGASQFLCLLGNALEKSVDTAMSMRCRGYGLEGASRRKPYAFHARDGWLLGVILLLTFSLCIVFFYGNFQFHMLPGLEWPPFRIREIAGYLFYTAYVLLPLITLGREEWMWRSLRWRM